MKANELMIGDWVQGYLPDTFSQVQGIINDYRIAVIGGKAYMELSIDDFQPIPLTREILEKNGFGYIEEDELMGYTHFYLGEPQYCANMNLHIGSNNRGFFWLNYLRNDIESIHFVHELQHALRLCGIDKEIEICHL